MPTNVANGAKQLQCPECGHVTPMHGLWGGGPYTAWCWKCGHEGEGFKEPRHA